MKNLFLLIIMLLTVTTGFAQEAVEGLDPSFSAIKSLLLPAVMTGVAVLISDASKYINTPQWDTTTFLKTKALPFGLTAIGAVVLYLVLAYLPWSKPFIELYSDTTIGTVSAASLFGVAQAIVNGILKPSKATEPEQGGDVITE